MKKFKLKKSVFDVIDHLIGKSLKTSVSSSTEKSILMSVFGPVLILKFAANKSIRSNYDRFSIGTIVKNDLSQQ